MSQKSIQRSQQAGSRRSKAKARAAAQAQARAPPSNKARKPRGQRWGFDVGDFNAGPISLGRLSFSSKKEAMPAPMGNGYTAMKMQSTSPRMWTVKEEGVDVTYVKGTDYFATLESNGTEQPGDVIYSLPINPATWAKTLAARHAKCWERWYPHSLNFYYAPVATPDSMAGQLLGFMTYDYTTVFESGAPDNVQRAAAHFSQFPTQVAQPLRWEAPYPQKVDPASYYYVRAERVDPATAFAGHFYILAASTFSAGGPMGLIYAEWVFKFYESTMDDDVAEIIRENILTVDTSSWNNTLSFPLDGTFTESSGTRLPVVWDSVARTLTFSSVPAGMHFHMAASFQLTGSGLTATAGSLTVTQTGLSPATKLLAYRGGTVATTLGWIAVDGTVEEGDTDTTEVVLTLPSVPQASSLTTLNQFDLLAVAFFDGYAKPRHDITYRELLSTHSKAVRALDRVAALEAALFSASPPRARGLDIDEESESGPSSRRSSARPDDLYAVKSRFGS